MAVTRGGIHGDQKAEAQAEAQAEVPAHAQELGRTDAADWHEDGARLQAALASAQVAGMTVVSKRIDELIPAEYNPRKITDAKLAGLRASLRRFKLVEPIVWNKRTGHVVGGHQRLKASAMLGETEIACVVVDLSLDEERALNVALNNPAIQGRFDETVHEILDEIRVQDPRGYEELRIDTLSDLLTYGEEVPEPKGSRPTRVHVEDHEPRPSPDLEPESSSRSLRLTFTHNDFAFVKRALRRLAGVYANDNASAIVLEALKEALDRHSPPE